MSDIPATPKAYIAGIGMITSIGADAPSTAAAVNAEVSGYQLSDFFNKQGHPMTLSPLPDEVFTLAEIEIDDGNYGDEHAERIIKMAILALYEATSHLADRQPIPLVLGMPESMPGTTSGIPFFTDYPAPEKLISNLTAQQYLPLRADWIQRLPTGRAAGIHGVELAMRALYEKGHDYVLVGGSDSYRDIKRLYDLDEDERVLASNRSDGFAPGEGAGFLLLTRHPQLALAQDEQIIALHPPGISEEPGYLYADSDKIYRGDGLDQAFKQALNEHSGADIQRIYSSMNGEHYWAKECGVALLRSRAHFQDPITIEHPADCFGDLGIATGSVLVGLAATQLLKQPGLATHMVYSSSDGPGRAAVLVEKIHRKTTEQEENNDRNR